MTLGFTDGNRFAGLSSNSSQLGYFSPSNYGKPVGSSQETSTFRDTATIGITTDPTKSGIETSSSGLKLYFYVGETIQDANVIVAGRVLSALSNKVGFEDRETVVGWGMPDYSAWLSVSNPYTVEFPCLVVAQSGTNTGIRLKVNGDYILSGYIGANSGNSYVYGFVDVGDTVQGENYAGSLSPISLKVCPLKGVN